MSAAQQSYHHGNLKTALLEQAKKHLQTVGPDKLSLRALARDLGVSQTAPYRHFADKTELFAALAAEGFRMLIKTTQEAIADCPTAKEKLHTSAKAYICFAMRNADLYRLMFGPMIPPDSDYEELREAGNQSFQAIIEIIDQGIKSGEFRQEDTMVFANSAWAMVHGISSLIIDDRFACTEHEVSPDELDRALAVIYDGMKS